MQYSDSNNGTEIYKTIIDASPFPVYLCKGPNLLVTMANQATLNVWGKTKDVIGKPFHEILPELANQPFRDILLDVYHNGIINTSTEQLAEIKVNGELQQFYFTCSYQPYIEDNSTITGVFCIANDVTELVLAKHNLKASDETARLALAAAQLGTFDHDLLSGEIIWDARARELFEIPTEKTHTPQGSFFPGLHPNDHDRVNSEVMSYTSSEQVTNGGYDVEYRTLSKQTEQIRWLRSSGKLIFNDTGVPIRFVGTVLDITDIKKADKQSAMLAAIINCSFDAIISKDLDGNVETWNDAAQTMFGYTANEMIGKSIYTLIPKELHAEEQSIMASLKEGIAISPFETKRLGKNQQRIDVSITISPIKNRRGDVIGLSKIARNITEQKMSEKLKENFVTIASHELNTPLTTIIPYVKLLLKKATDDGDAFRINALTSIQRQTNKMSILIKNLLNNTKLAAGNFEMEMQHFNLQQLLVEIVSNAKVLIQTHQIVLEDCNDMMVLADRSKIGHVMDSLISNAVKFSEPGTDIIVTCRQDEGNAKVSISDSGFGIRKSDQERIFMRYFRSEDDKVKNISGFGIGLYLVAEILRNHKTKIYIDSEENKGSSFYFYLPLKH